MEHYGKIVCPECKGAADWPDAPYCYTCNPPPGPAIVKKTREELLEIYGDE